MGNSVSTPIDGVNRFYPDHQYETINETRIRNSQSALLPPPLPPRNIQIVSPRTLVDLRLMNKPSDDVFGYCITRFDDGTTEIEIDSEANICRQGHHIKQKQYPEPSDDASELVSGEFVFNKSVQQECEYCDIVKNKKELQLKDKNTCVVINDNKPKAKHHFLVLSKQHISKPTDLTVADVPLLEEMERTGRELLREQLQKKNEAETVEEMLRIGFRMPPLLSVHHLHMHIIYPISDMGLISRKLTFRPGKVFKPARELINQLKNGQSSKVNPCKYCCSEDKKELFLEDMNACNLFNDVKSKSEQHLVIFSKKHFLKIADLTISDVPLLKRMESIGRQMLTELLLKESETVTIGNWVNVGIIIPPLLTENHIELHVLYKMTDINSINFLSLNSVINQIKEVTQDSEGNTELSTKNEKIQVQKD